MDNDAADDKTIIIPDFSMRHILSDEENDAKASPTATTIQEKFEKFHNLNPMVYNHLVDLARRLVGRGHKKVGIGMLFEVLRWNYLMTTDDPSSEFKLCNNYRSRYSRLIMEREKDLADVFDTRDLRSL